MSADAPPTGQLARSAIAGMAAARAGVAHLGHRAQALTRSGDQAEQARLDHEARLGRILFGALNQLKGTALKASQMLSMELDLLPDGMRQELARAHYQVTPLNRALVIKLMRQEFGQEPDQLFAQFEPAAFAAASLGQVHGATLASGERVAVKLQYPGMAASIGNDVAMLRTLIQTLGRAADGLPKAAIIDQVLADIELKLGEELDYLHEAEQLDWFAQAFSAWPGLVVPRTYPQFSSKRMLTMQRLPGLHLKEWLATQPGQAERDHYGQLLFDAFFHSLFTLGRLQADPHPGNYLFMPDGQLGLLDFGCTRRIGAHFRRAISLAWSAQLRQPCDVAALQQAYLDLGLLDPALSAQDFRERLLPVLTDMLTWQVRPFSAPEYDFGQHPSLPQMSAGQRRLAAGYLNGLAPDLPYFDRAYRGLLQMLQSMAARVRTTNPFFTPVLPTQE